MGPDEEALRRDLAALSFKVGERRGKWRLLGIKFPLVLFFVAAAPRPDGPVGFLLLSECSGYSATAPTSQLWHGGQNAPLAVANRPHTAQGVVLAFQDWGKCLYHPIDRLARDHNNWPVSHPEKLWTPDKDITFLLETVYALLHTSEYLRANLPPEALKLPQSFMA